MVSDDDSSRRARAREHVIETNSRRIVVGHFEAERWVERDLTERDYGVDLTLEHFDAGEPSGRLLLLQLKGTDGDAPDADSSSIPFDAKVAHLLRAERFATPILLCWVPVNDDMKRAWFVWIQGYIRMVLDFDNPTWRSQRYVRIHIPCDNLLGSVQIERKLIHIAGDPARAAQFGQLSRLAHEARWAEGDPRALLSIFEEALALDAIFGDPDWDWSQSQRRMLEKGLLACQIAVRGIDPTNEELKEIGWHLENPPLPEDWEHRWDLLASGAQHCAQLISTAVALYYDNRLRNSVWKAVGDHDF